MASSAPYLLPGSKSILIRQSSSISTNENFTIPSLLPKDDTGGISNGVCLSQSMESINNIGLTDDEVRLACHWKNVRCCVFFLFLYFFRKEKEVND